MRKINKKFAVIALIILVIAVSTFIKLKGGKVVEAEVMEVKLGDVYSYIEETGTVKSENQRLIYSKSMGEIKKINIKEGDIVKKDDILIEIDSETIDLEIKSLEAQLAGLKAQYKEAVKPVDKSRIAQAEATVQSGRVNVEEARRNVENSKKLFEEGAISQDDYQAALNNLALQENQLKIAENELALLKKGVSSNIKNQYEAQIAQIAYQIEILKKSKNELYIKSPIDGMVMAVSVKEGAYIQPGMQLAEIGNNQEFYIESDVLSSEVGDIREGNDVIIWSEDLGVLGLKGVVRKIYPKAYSKVSDLGIEQKRVKVEIDIDGNNEKLKPGYELDVKFISNKKDSVLLVHEDSVFELEDGKYVFVLENDKAVLRKVKTGIEGDEMVEILSGLKEGEKVIISPDDEIEEGMKIKVIE